MIAQQGVPPDRQPIAEKLALSLDNPHSSKFSNLPIKVVERGINELDKDY